MSSSNVPSHRWSTFSCVDTATSIVSTTSAHVHAVVVVRCFSGRFRWLPGERSIALRVILNATFTFDLQLRSTTSILDVERVSVSLRQWCFLTGVRVRVVVLRWCCCCHVALAGCPLGALLQLATVIPTDCGVHELLGFFSEL